MQAVKESVTVWIEKNLELPSIPLVLTRIIQVLDDNTASARVLEDLILHDPSLSSRILKLANSAFYSFRSEVKTISHAVALLGLNLVKSLAIGVTIFESFTKGVKSEATLINRLWMHSFGVGVLAKDIWIRRSTPREGEFAFLCGLLHDVGKGLFFKRDCVHYCHIFARNRSGAETDLCASERETYGSDHATIGAMLAKHWGFPPELVAVIRRHHDALNSNLPLVAAVSMADAFTRSAHIGYDGDRSLVSEVERLQAQLNMDEEEFEAMLAVANSRREDVEQFFKAQS